MSQQLEFKLPDAQNSNPSPSHTPHAVLKVEPTPELKPGRNAIRKERTLDEQQIQRIKSENSVRKLPRKASIAGNTFYISYGCLIFSGSYSIHHVIRGSDKRLFSLKVDDRDPAIILRHEKVRSKLAGVDLPKIIHSERKSSVTLNVMEPLSMTFKNLIRGFSMKREDRLSNSAILLRTGRMCIRLLKKLHDNGILHGNINPHTFVFPCKPDRQNVKPDLKRGPIIIDFSHAIDCEKDLLYKENSPESRFSSAIYPEDGGIYTKRDDVENLGYLLLFLANGHISWEVRKRRDQLLFGKKCLSDLNRNVKGIPLVIKNFITYVRTIKWNATPDYELLDMCLAKKNIDIRAEIKSRRERLRLKLRRKRKREPSADIYHRIGVGAGMLKAQREQANTRPKRRHVDEKCYYNSASPETEPEYFQMSLQLVPDIALKISDPDEKIMNVQKNRTIEHRLALSTYGPTELDENLNHGTRDRFFTRPARDDAQKKFEDKFSVPRIDWEVDSVEDGCNDSTGSADTNQQDMLFTHKMRNEQTNLRHQQQQINLLRTRTTDNIQFHFPFLQSDSDDELRHPWEKEIAPFISRMP